MCECCDNQNTNGVSRRQFLTSAASLCAGTLAVGPLSASPISGKHRNSGTQEVDAFLAERLTFRARSLWQPAAPILSRLRRAPGSYRSVTIHHQGGTINGHVKEEAVVHDLRAIQQAHFKKRYGDIAYHFLVDYAGVVWEGRSLTYQGAHVSGNNVQNIGVMLCGNFEKQRPSDAQLDTLQLLTRLLQVYYRMSNRNVFAHRDLGHTACPGRYLYPYVEQLRHSTV